MEKSSFKLFKNKVIFVRNKSALKALETSKSGMWPVATPILNPSETIIIKDDFASKRSVKYSVCPGKLNSSDWMLCLLIGAVTSAEISPRSRSLAALSKQSKAAFPASLVSFPGSTSVEASSQQLMTKLSPDLASDASLMTAIDHSFNSNFWR